MTRNKTYLGDGVYIEESPSSLNLFILTTENGIETTNKIYLDPFVSLRLLDVLAEKLGFKKDSLLLRGAVVGGEEELKKV